MCVCSWRNISYGNNQHSGKIHIYLLNFSPCDVGGSLLKAVFSVLLKLSISV